MSVVEFEMIRKFILVSIEVKIAAGILWLHVALIELQSLIGTLDVVAGLSFFPVDSTTTGIAVHEAMKVSIFSSDVD